MKPGMVLTPAFSASFFEAILSPMPAIASTFGPMNTIPAAASALAKRSFSERNP